MKQIILSSIIHLHPSLFHPAYLYSSAILNFFSKISFEGYLGNSKISPHPPVVGVLFMFPLFNISISFPLLLHKLSNPPTGSLDYEVINSNSLGVSYLGISATYSQNHCITGESSLYPLYFTCFLN